MTDVRMPAAAPCASCPYRADVPSGVWDADEYAKLPPYDSDTAFQPTSLFMCHQQDGRLCAGWCATAIPVFPSGAAAALHGRKHLLDPPPDALDTIARLHRKLR